MGSFSDIPIGERVKFFRGRKTQLQVAHDADISVHYLSEIERGVKTPAIPVVYRLAKVLEVSVSALLGEPSYEEGDVPEVTPSLRRALLGFVPPIDGELPDLPNLRQRVHDTYATWRKHPANYSMAGEALPTLVLETEQALRAFHTPAEVGSRREAYLIAASLYILLENWFQQIKRIDLAVLCGDRALRAAEASDDPLYVSAARFHMGHALLSDNEIEASEDMVLRTAEELLPRLADGGSTETGLYGALHLVAAVAAVRSSDPVTARALIRDNAEPAARKSGEADPFWTSFGPTNVAVHAMSVETEAGQAHDAIRLADRVDPDKLPAVTRRANFYLDLGKAHEQQHDDLGLFFHLSQLETAAPEFARYNPIVRDMVRALGRRARPSYTSQIRAMAKRLNVSLV